MESLYRHGSVQSETINDYLKKEYLFIGIPIRSNKRKRQIVLSNEKGRFNTNKNTTIEHFLCFKHNH